MSDSGSTDELAMPRIEFPCEYPVKVMGRFADDFVDLVTAIGRMHAPELDADRIRIRPSRNGRWVSVTMTIRATGEPQLQALFEDLKATGRTEFVL